MAEEVAEFDVSDDEVDFIVKSLSLSSDALVKKIKRVNRAADKEEFLALSRLLTKFRQEQVERIVML